MLLVKLPADDTEDAHESVAVDAEHFCQLKI
jgi:hypothetical protein